MTLPLIIIIVYLITIFVISIYSIRLSKGVMGFLLAERGFSTSIVAVMIAGLAIGGASTVGVAEQAYEAGISAGWYNGAWAAGAIVFALLAASKYRKISMTTIPEIIGKFFGEPSRILAIICQIFIQIIITSLQYVAGGAILASLLPDIFTLKSGMITSAIVFITITAAGGYWAAGLGNFVNVIVIYSGIITSLLMSIRSSGGFNSIVQSLPPEKPWFNLFEGIGLPVISAWFIVMITQAFSTQSVCQISFAAKNEKSARNGFIIGGILIFPVGFICALMGIISAATFPDIKPALALPKIILKSHPLSAGLALAGLWAADVSTATGLLISSSTLVVQDIAGKYFKKNLNEREQFIATKIITIAISIITFILALTVSGILKTLLIGLTLATPLTIVILASLYTPSLCRKSSALWTIVAGIAALGLWVFIPGLRFGPHPIFEVWFICLLVFLIVRFIDRRPI